MIDVPQVEVPVWDAPVRIVHWLLVALLIALVTTGLLGNDWLQWHMRAGYAMLTLVLFRIVWGFAGSRNARFLAFVRGPRTVRAYARSLRMRTRDVHATLVMLRDNLVRPMISGRKRLPGALADASLASASLTLAAAFLVCCAAFVWWLVTKA